MRSTLTARTMATPQPHPMLSRNGSDAAERSITIKRMALPLQRIMDADVIRVFSTASSIAFPFDNSSITPRDQDGHTLCKLRRNTFDP